jgi:hypothetical protein
MEHLIALLPLLSSMPALQVFVGAAVAVTCVAMVLRANKDKHEVPPPAPGTVSDAMVHLQGPAEVLTLLRELRDLGRQEVELLRSIDREQIRNQGHD